MDTKHRTSEIPGRRERMRRMRRTITSALRLAWSASPRGFVANVSIAMSAAAMPPVVVWLGKRLVDLIAEGTRAPIAVRALIPTVVALGIFASIQRVLTSLSATRQELFSRGVALRAEDRFLEQAASVDLGHFDNSDWHDRMARAKRELNWRPFQLTWSVIGLGSSSLTVAGMLGLLFALHPLLLVLSLVSVLPSVTFQRRIQRKIYDFWFQHTPADREREYLSELLSQPRTAKEIRAFTLEPYLLGRYRTIADGQYRKMQRLYALYNRAAVATGILSGTALAIAYGFVAVRGSAGRFTPGDLTAVIGAIAAVTQQIGLISGSLLSIDQHTNFLEDYFSFLEIPPLLEVRPDPVPLPDRLDDGVRFENVSFTYRGGTALALDGVDLHVRPGELVALVGDNGAGKTTMVKLLLRFYDPDAGAVRIGGVDIRDADPSGVRSRIGVLFQDYAMYELSARENVVLGRVERTATDADVEAALQAARAHTLVAGFPKGIDSKVGRLFEGGHDLSGGEWQRLALARLMYRDADLWILDEPTSSLDPEVEAAVFAELRENLRGRMGIVISHRFSTVRIADRIAVMHGGRIIELGTHEELLAQDGRYAHLFELQASGYR